MASWLRSLGRGVAKIGGGVAKASRTVGRVPGAKFVPGLGTGLALIGGASAIGSAVSDVFTGGGGGGDAGLPALPSGGGMPMLPGTGMADPRVGMRSIFRDDPNVVAALQPWAIPARALKTYVRAPIKGFVVRYDNAGTPYAIPKFLATKYLGYKPAKKPPISVGEWQAIKTADRASKKIKKAMTTVARVEKNIKGGKVVVPRKKKG